MLEQECNVALSLAIGGVDFEIEEETSTTEERHIERLRLPNNIEESPPVSTVARDGGDGKGGKRKKLRLSQEQLSLLEDRFGAHNTLSPDQKQDLAQRLNLQPRQVEVWFQNRRARTKLKQTDVAYKFLKKYCDRLTSENRRLKRELMELRLAKTGSQLSVELRKAARLSMCSSCQKMMNDEKESTS